VIALLSISQGLVMIYLAVIGPLIQNKIIYKTSPLAINQMYGQDIANLILLSPLLIISGVLLILNKPIYKYLLILTPISIIYFALSYVVGLEWSSSIYTGNSEQYFYLFLFLIMASLIIMMYSLSQFKENNALSVNKKHLIIYSAIFTLSLMAFTKMWLTEVNDVILTGTSASYEATPTLFWVIRAFDLGIVIPLGFISLYLWWTRPNQSLALILLFYGFFITTGIAVNAMGISMYLNNDPTLDKAGLIVFVVLLLVVLTGFVFIIKNLKRIK